LDQALETVGLVDQAWRFPSEPRPPFAVKKEGRLTIAATTGLAGPAS
jgi:hypothetical protein